MTNSLTVDSEGHTLLMVCVITTGYPYTSIMWYKDGNEITNNSLTSIYNEQFEGNGLLFTSSILEVCSVGPENSGSYSCVASNHAGNDSREFELKIQRGELEIIKHTIMQVIGINNCLFSSYMYFSCDQYNCDISWTGGLHN